MGRSYVIHNHSCFEIIPGLIKALDIPQTLTSLTTEILHVLYVAAKHAISLFPLITVYLKATCIAYQILRHGTGV